MGPEPTADERAGIEWGTHSLKPSAPRRFAPPAGDRMANTRRVQLTRGCTTSAPFRRVSPGGMGSAKPSGKERSLAPVMGPTFRARRMPGANTEDAWPSGGALVQAAPTILLSAISQRIRMRTSKRSEATPKLSSNVPTVAALGLLKRTAQSGSAQSVWKVARPAAARDGYATRMTMKSSLN